MAFSLGDLGRGNTGEKPALGRRVLMAWQLGWGARMGFLKRKKIKILMAQKNRVQRKAEGDNFVAVSQGEVPLYVLKYAALQEEVKTDNRGEEVGGG